jgi:malonyl CoA-acyl carrier protein transacylase
MTNYILTGNLNVNGNMVITGTVYDIKSLGTLVKKLEEGGYKNIMELRSYFYII